MKGLADRVRRLPGRLPGLRVPGPPDPRLMTHGARQRRIAELLAKAAASVGLDPTDVAAAERVIEDEADRAVAELATALALPPDERLIAAAMAERAAARGDHALAARWAALAAREGVTS